MGVVHPVSGFERPWIQWTFVALGLLLAALVAAEAVEVRRTREQRDAARAAEVDARLDRTQIELELSRERTAREALAVEAARLRGTAAIPTSPPPTLTLTPLGKRGAAPPPPSAEAPGRDQVIQLRLVLPRSAPGGLTGFTIALRTWSSGVAVWTRSGIALPGGERSGGLVAPITGDALAPGAYELLLTATNGAGQTVEVATYEVTIAPPKR